MSTVVASGNGNGEREFTWITSSLTQLSTLFSSCIERPTSPGFSTRQYKATLQRSSNATWEPTGIRVQGDRSIDIKWKPQNISSSTKIYKVMYRIDPRFDRPQIFIKTFNREDGSYESDFHRYMGGELIDYQGRPERDFANRTRDFVDYFNFAGREEIMMQRNDAVNILIEEVSEFLAPSNYNDSSPVNEFSSDYQLSGPAEPELIYTDLPITNNKILYMNAEHWCTGLSATCTSGSPILYENAANPRSVYTGNAQEPNLFNAVASGAPCGDSVIGLDHPFCYFDKGRGMKITQAGTTVKDTYEPFVLSNATGRYFYYYIADSDGPLRFSTDMQIDGMITNYNQLMRDWNQSSYDDFRDYLANLPIQQSQSLFMHMGRYIMTIEVGSSDGSISVADIESLDVEYYIQPDGGDAPEPSDSGTEISQNFRTNAANTGYLWVRANSANNDITGWIDLTIKNYTGYQWFSGESNVFSAYIYDLMVGPIRDKINEVSIIIYSKLITDGTLQRIARSALVLYIIIYALMFLMGATDITVNDIVIRVLKIGVILTLFSENGWNFFNTYLFNVFVEGTDYLMSTVVGETSQVGNPFRFIDPVIDRYTNPTLWALIGIQLLQIHNGLCFFAILTIYSILIYYRALLEVIVSYVLAYIGMGVLISLAPFFIILMLFEKTKSMFDAWLSSLFNFMIQPTILLIFFLLIDQLMAQQITHIVVRACWDIIIPINIGLDLTHLGIPISFSFPLSFLPGIPFYVSQVEEISSTAMLFGREGTFLTIATSSLLFFAYCKLAAGLVDYVSVVVQMLTNVMAARQYGRLQKGSDIVGQITKAEQMQYKPIKMAAKSTGKFAKRKFVDQKYDHRPGEEGPDYSLMIRGNIDSSGGGSGGAGGSGGLGSSGGAKSVSGSGGSSESSSSSSSGSSGGTGGSGGLGSSGGAKGAGGSGITGALNELGSKAEVSGNKIRSKLQGADDRLQTGVEATANKLGEKNNKTADRLRPKVEKSSERTKSESKKERSDINEKISKLNRGDKNSDSNSDS